MVVQKCVFFSDGFLQHTAICIYQHNLSFQLCETLKTYTATKTTVPTPPADPNTYTLSTAEKKRHNIAQNLFDQMLTVHDDLLDELRCRATILFHEYQKMEPGKPATCDMGIQMNSDDLPFIFEEEQTTSTTTEMSQVQVMHPEYVSALAKIAFQLQNPVDCPTGTVSAGLKSQLKVYPEPADPIYGGLKQIPLVEANVTPTVD